MLNPPHIVSSGWNKTQDTGEYFNPCTFSFFPLFRTHGWVLKRLNFDYHTSTSSFKLLAENSWIFFFHLLNTNHRAEGLCLWTAAHLDFTNGAFSFLFALSRWLPGWQVDAEASFNINRVSQNKRACRSASWRRKRDLASVRHSVVLLCPVAEMQMRFLS